MNSQSNEFSEEIRELLSNNPRWITVVGTVLIFVVVALSLVVGYAIKTPEIIQVEAAFKKNLSSKGVVVVEKSRLIVPKLKNDNSTNLINKSNSLENDKECDSLLITLRFQNEGDFNKIKCIQSINLRLATNRLQHSDLILEKIDSAKWRKSAKFSYTTIFSIYRSKIVQDSIIKDGTVLDAQIILKEISLANSLFQHISFKNR